VWFSASGRTILLVSPKVYLDILRESALARALKWSTPLSLVKIWPIIGHNLKTVQDRRLLLITNRKSHMGFRLVPKSVTLHDLERCNGHVVCVILLNSVAFVAYYIKVVEDTLTHSASEMTCSPKNLVFSGISFITIFARNHPQQGRWSEVTPCCKWKFDTTWKWCKIGGKSVLITKRKLYMVFLLVSKSVTLNDLERRNGHVVCVIRRIR